MGAAGAGRAEDAARKGGAALLAAGLVLAGCAPRPEPPSAPPPPPRLPVERAYEPPAGSPPPPPALAVPLAPERAIAALAEALGEALGEAGSRLRRGTSPDGSAWLVLTSSGDPEPFLDCGSFEALGEAGSVERLPAARLSVRLPVQPPERREVLLRQLRLDGRLAVVARPEGRGSRLAVEASYVLTRTVDRVALDGRVLETQRETAAFRTGEVGRLEQGLVCRPTGRLEQAVVEAAERLMGPAGAAAGDAPASGRAPRP